MDLTLLLGAWMGRIAAAAATMPLSQVSNNLGGRTDTTPDDDHDTEGHDHGHSKRHVFRLCRAQGAAALKRRPLLITVTCALAAWGLYATTSEGSTQALRGALSFTQVNKEDTQVNKEGDMAVLDQRLRKQGWSLMATFLGTNVTDMPLIGRDEFKSQAGQEKTVLKLLNYKENGFFLDLASNDAIFNSNTVALEQNYGWRGICVEANPGYLPGLRKRKCQLVHATVGKVDDEEVQFNIHETPGWEGIVGKDFDNKESTRPLTFRTLSLATLLKTMGAPSVIDYLSLDIEGAEAWVFETFPWETYTFLTLTVERPKRELEEALAAHQYIYLCDHENWGDQLWVHESLPRAQEFKEIFHALPLWKSSLPGVSYRECRTVL